VFAFGSLDEPGTRRAPLLQLHVSDRWSLDAHASLGYNLSDRLLEERYLVGGTFTW
jgi:hypothetical protein